MVVDLIQLRRCYIFILFSRIFGTIGLNFFSDAYNRTTSSHTLHNNFSHFKFRPPYLEGIFRRTGTSNLGTRFKCSYLVARTCQVCFWRHW